MKSLFCVVGLSGKNGGNAKRIGARLDMIKPTAGRSRPDFTAVALLSMAHRSFGRSAFILQRGQVKRGTSEPSKLHWPFMRRSSKGSSQGNSSSGQTWLLGNRKESRPEDGQPRMALL